MWGCSPLIKYDKISVGAWNKSWVRAVVPPKVKFLSKKIQWGISLSRDVLALPLAAVLFTYRGLVGFSIFLSFTFVCSNILFVSVF